MSKLIIEMEMPRACPCELATEIEGNFYPCFAYYGVVERAVEFDKCVSDGNRPSWCPICDVLPDEHGDLIDRDKFVDKYIRHYTEQERKMNLVFAAVEVKQDFADMIYEEDAVIAAERKADEQIH